MNGSEAVLAAGGGVTEDFAPPEHRKANPGAAALLPALRQRSGKKSKLQVFS